MGKGQYTKKNVLDQAADLEIYRGGEKLDPGVNYFVLMLAQMGLPTHYSCEGHPGGFYITFNASYEQALAIQEIGYASVEIEGNDYWSIRKHIDYKDTPRKRIDGFRWTAAACERAFGPLDFDNVTLST